MSHRLPRRLQSGDEIKPEGEHTREDLGRYNMYIRSKDRSYGTAESFTYVLDNGISVRENEQLLVSVSNTAIPLTIYSTNSTNNILRFTDVATYDLTITPGNYNAITFAQAVEDLINGVSAEATWSITYSETTSKFTFNKPAGIASYTLDFSVANNCYRQLGFENDTAYTRSTATYTAPQFAVITGIDTLYVRSRSLTSMSTYDSRIGGQGSNILIELPLVNGYNSIVFGGNTENEIALPVGSGIEELDFQLTDSDGNVLDFNGSEWTISLLIRRTNALFANFADETDRRVEELLTKKKTKAKNIQIRETARRMKEQRSAGFERGNPFA